ncbi:MAG: C39 family peptidase [Alphaproteobacteria bacterium]|nr:C39 family peptidase [Alphaproteobacteria bacterium]
MAHILTVIFLAGCGSATKQAADGDQNLARPGNASSGVETISDNISFFDTEPNAALVLLRRSYETVSENAASRTPRDIEALSEEVQTTISANPGGEMMPGPMEQAQEAEDSFVLSTAPDREVIEAESTISRTDVAHASPPKIDAGAIQKLPKPKVIPSAVVQNGQKGDTVRVGVTSWSDLPFQTVKRQAFDFSCGSAAVATLMTYVYGIPTTEKAVFREMFERGDKGKIRREGFSMLDMSNYLKAHGLEAKGFRISRKVIEKHRLPFIALVNNDGYNHFVVVKTMDDGRVLVGDPSKGSTVYPKDVFSTMWNGFALIVLNDAATAQKAFADAKEWKYARARAPLRNGNDAGNETTGLAPMNWQIAPIVGDLLPAMTGSIN